MSDPSFDLAMAFVYKWEGGYINHPSDLGGATNHGVTQKVYDVYRRKMGLPPQPVIRLEFGEMRAIYKNDYWFPSRANLMIQPLATAHFDTAVNFGVVGAIKFLQETLGGLTVDGVFGDKTLKRLQERNTSYTAYKLVKARIAYRYQRVTEQPDQRVFLQGWLNRDQDLLRYIHNEARSPDHG